jgi:membrane-associated phospholipid phosphatase
LAVIVKSCLLQSISVLTVASVASVGAAQAQSATPNITVSNANALDLLGPFLGLNSSAIGQQTLADNLTNTIAVNNTATPALQSLALSDNNILFSTSNTVPGLSGSFGIAANLGGGLPPQPAINGITPSQPIGGLGTQLGAIYDKGVNAFANGDHTVLPATVGLLASGTVLLSDAVVAKNYLANGTEATGTKPAVPPPGFTLSTHNGLPNTTDSVYDIAYGVKNTDPGQDPLGNSRPFQVSDKINLLNPALVPQLEASPAFPSGHTSFAFTDALLIGMMVPELYQSMMLRASEYGNSRIVLGVHYALDVIGGRSLGAYDLAQAFTNPAYINNAATTGRAIDLPALFQAAAPELRAYLSAGCGGTLASCAGSAANMAGNPYVPSAVNAAAYANNLTYGLPTLTFKQAPQEAAPAGGPDASILLATLYGGGSKTAHDLANAATGGTDGSGLLGSLSTDTINQIIVNTETNALAAFYGTSLSYWSRINLYAAAGYFQGVTGALNLASTDTVKTDVTIDATGTLGGTGAIAGNVANAGGAIRPGDAPGVLTIHGNLDESIPGDLEIELGGTTPGTDYSQLIVDGSASLLGKLELSLVSGFSLATGQTFDIVGSGDGLTNGLESLSLDGAACAAEGGDTFKCWGGGSFFDIFTLSTLAPGALVPGGMNPEDLTLGVTLTPVPEPSTWAMMLAGFAGLGYFGYRTSSRRTRSAAA